MTVDKIIHSKEFLVFLDNAKKFCSFLEFHKSNTSNEFLCNIQKMLVDLYLYGITLPEFELPKNEDIEEIRIADEDIKEISSFIEDRIGDPFYWIVVHPKDHTDNKSVCGDLVDDLGDIYKDLKTFLHGIEDSDDDVKQNTLWHLKWSFDNHWNDHSINAIYAIHYFLKQNSQKYGC